MLAETRKRLQQRMAQLQHSLGEHGWRAALIMQPRDLFYYAGTAQPANLWVPVEGEPILFSRRAHELIRKETWIRQQEQASGFTQMAAILKERGMLPAAADAVALELDVLPYQLVESFKRAFPGTRLASLSSVILKQRFVKDEWEIRQIRQAVELWRRGHHAVKDALSPGVREHQVAAVWESAVRSGGGDGIVWFRRWDACLPGGGIVASGENGWVVSGHAMTVTGVGQSQALPWGASERQLEQGDLVVLDFGLCRQGYHCDIARTYCVGKASEDRQDLWKRLLSLHMEVISRIKPGITGHELYLFADELAARQGLREYFMGVAPERGNYIGHSIGLELDEWPVLGAGAHEPLLPGAVITIEPKFMIPGRGAVMIEDDILVTDTGCEVISTIDRELDAR
ncbi:M24 family metallopeptidase [Brevibacillus marinus]|uniref:M24 family metallopeptidase n=1 Tax=Brevibacillus marinus TaxID=2496837 RepID=UPI001F495EDD|nr:Xaa-Pro peptidase family protein [Brevibacillus marinus]